MYCDKHNNPEIHKPLYPSKSGGLFCPNVERTLDDGKTVYCSFQVAPTHSGTLPARSANPGIAAGVNSIIRGWVTAGVGITDAKIKEAIKIVQRTDYLLTHGDEDEANEVEIL